MIPVLAFVAGDGFGDLGGGEAAVMVRLQDIGRGWRR